MPFMKCWRVVVGNGYFFSEFSIVASTSQSADCPSLRGNLWPSEMKSQLAIETLSQMWIQWCRRSLVSYHLCEGMSLTLLRFPLRAWRLYFTQVNVTRLQHLDGWRDTEKYRIAYFKTDCLLIKMEGGKSQSHFFNMLLLTALINLVSAASK